MEEFFKEFQQAKFWIDEYVGKNIHHKNVLKKKEKFLKKRLLQGLA